MKIYYEVVYLYFLGLRGKSFKRFVSYFGKRKKNFCGSLVFKDDYDDMSEIEFLDIEEEDDFSG